MKKINYSKGFTLVELLVVIAIIGVLSTLLLLQLNVVRAKGRDTKRANDVGQLQTAVELYYDENGSYPTALTDLIQYMTSGAVPKDPSSGADYGYAWSPASSPTKYQLWAKLERKNASYTGGDADIDSLTWSGATSSGADTCTTADNCIYDVGVK